MALRMLSDTTRLLLTQHSHGVVTVNGTIGNLKHSFLLDTTLPGIVYRCDCNQVNDYCDDYKDLGSDRDETCPTYCKSSFNVDLIDTGSIWAEAVPSKVSLMGYSNSGFSKSEFRAGRVCDYYSYSLFDYGIKYMVDGVLGLGPDKPTASKNMDSLPWSKFSIYLTESTTETGSFLLVGDADTEVIQQKQLTEIKLPATFEEGWTLSMSEFIVNDVPVEDAYCSVTSPCQVTISASSSVIQLKDSVWRDVKDLIVQDKYKCYSESFGTDYVYVCNDDIVLPRLGFTFGKQTLFVDKEHYTLPFPGKPGRIAVMLQTEDKSEAAPWYLGTPFLRAYYTSFDKDAKTVSFYSKKGNYAENFKTKPNVWYETVDTTSDGIKNIRWAGYITAIIAFALVSLLSIAFIIRQKKRAKATASQPQEAEPEPSEQYEQAVTPSKREDSEPPRDSIFV